MCSIRYCSILSTSASATAATRSRTLGAQVAAVHSLRLLSILRNLIGTPARSHNALRFLQSGRGKGIDEALARHLLDAQLAAYMDVRSESAMSLPPL